MIRLLGNKIRTDALWNIRGKWQFGYVGGWNGSQGPGKRSLCVHAELADRYKRESEGQKERKGRKRKISREKKDDGRLPSSRTSGCS